MPTSSAGSAAARAGISSTSSIKAMSVTSAGYPTSSVILQTFPRVVPSYLAHLEEQWLIVMFIRSSCPRKAQSTTGSLACAASTCSLDQAG